MLDQAIKNGKKAQFSALRNSEPKVGNLQINQYTHAQAQSTLSSSMKAFLFIECPPWARHCCWSSRPSQVTSIHFPIRPADLLVWNCLCRQLRPKETSQGRGWTRGDPTSLQQQPRVQDWEKGEEPEVARGVTREGREEQVSHRSQKWWRLSRIKENLNCAQWSWKAKGKKNEKGTTWPVISGDDWQRLMDRLREGSLWRRVD